MLSTIMGTTASAMMPVYAVLRSSIMFRGDKGHSCCSVCRPMHLHLGTSSSCMCMAGTEQRGWRRVRC